MHRQLSSTADCIGLAVACLTVVHEVLGLNRTVGSCVYRKKHYNLQPWAEAVRTLPAMPRSTEPSTLSGTVNEYQLFGLSNIIIIIIIKRVILKCR